MNFLGADVGARIPFSVIPAPFSVIPAPFSVIPAPFPVIPAQAGTYPNTHPQFIPPPLSGGLGGR